MSFATLSPAVAGKNEFISTSGNVEIGKRNKEAEKAMIVYMSETEVPENAKRIGIIYNTERKQKAAFYQV